MVKFVRSEEGDYWDVNGQQITEEQLRQYGVNIVTRRGNDETWKEVNGQPIEEFLPSFLSRLSDNQAHQRYRPGNDGDWVASDGNYLVNNEKYFEIPDDWDSRPGSTPWGNKTIDGKRFSSDAAFQTAHPSDGSDLGKWLPIIASIAATYGMGSLAFGGAAAGGAATEGFSPFAENAIDLADAALPGSGSYPMPPPSPPVPTNTGGMPPIPTPGGMPGLKDIASIAGIASGVAGLAGGSSGGSVPGGSGVTAYTPTGTGAADQSWQQMLQQLIQRQGAVSNIVDPALLKSFQNTSGIDTSGMIEAGDQAGGQYAELAKMLQFYSKILGNQAMGDVGRQDEIFGAGRDVYNLGRDPQEALRERELQRLIEMTRAGQSARGVATSPFAAGGESDAIKNFGIDWQNNLLSRSLAGLKGLTDAGDMANRTGAMAGADLTGSANFAGQAPAATQASGTTPVTTRKEAFAIPGNAAKDYATGMFNTGSVPMAAIQSNIIPYLNYGTGAGSNAFGQMADTRQFDATQNAASMEAILASLKDMSGPGSWLNNLWGAGRTSSPPPDFGQYVS